MICHKEVRAPPPLQSTATLVLTARPPAGGDVKVRPALGSVCGQACQLHSEWRCVDTHGVRPEECAVLAADEEAPACRRRRRWSRPSRSAAAAGAARGGPRARSGWTGREGARAHPTALDRAVSLWWRSGRCRVADRVGSGARASAGLEPEHRRGAGDLAALPAPGFRLAARDRRAVVREAGRRALSTAAGARRGEGQVAPSLARPAAAAAPRAAVLIAMQSLSIACARYQLPSSPQC